MCLFTYVHVYTYACVYVCVYRCLHECLYVYVHVHACVHHANTYMCVCVLKCGLLERSRACRPQPTKLCICSLTCMVMLGSHGPVQIRLPRTGINKKSALTSCNDLTLNYSCFLLVPTSASPSGIPSSHLSCTRSRPP